MSSRLPSFTTTYKLIGCVNLEASLDTVLFVPSDDHGATEISLQTINQPDAVQSIIV